MSKPQNADVSAAIAQKLCEVDLEIDKLQTQVTEIRSKIKQMNTLDPLESRECIRSRLLFVKKTILGYKTQLESLTDQVKRDEIQTDLDGRISVAKDLEYIVSSWEEIHKIEDDIKDWMRFRETLVAFGDIEQPTMVFKSCDGKLIYDWPVYVAHIPETCRKVLDDAASVLNAVNGELARTDFVVVLSRNISGNEMEVVRKKSSARIQVMNAQISKLEEAFQKLVDFDFEKEVSEAADKINSVIKENFVSLRDKIMATGQISEAIAIRTTQMQLERQAAQLRESIPGYKAVTELEIAAEGVIISSIKTLNAVLKQEIDLFSRV